MVRLDREIQIGRNLFPLSKGWERSHVSMYRLVDDIKAMGGKAGRLLGKWQVWESA